MVDLLDAAGSLPAAATLDREVNAAAAAARRASVDDAVADGGAGGGGGGSGGASSGTNGSNVRGAFVWDGEAVVPDALLRVIAPPLDSIRVGNMFSVRGLTWYAATQYPITLDLSVPPIGLPALQGGVPLVPRRPSGVSAASGMSGGSDPTAPLAVATPTARRMGVVLGQSYLVLGEMVARHASTGGAPATAGVSEPVAAAPPRPPAAPASTSTATLPGTVLVVTKARAQSVCPLHLTYTFTPPSSPNVLDVRLLARDDIPRSQALPACTDGVAVYTTSPHSGVATHVCGFTLVFDTADMCAAVAMYIDASRRRLMASKMDAILALELPPARPRPPTRLHAFVSIAE